MKAIKKGYLIAFSVMFVLLSYAEFCGNCEQEKIYICGESPVCERIK